MGLGKGCQAGQLFLLSHPGESTQPRVHPRCHQGQLTFPQKNNLQSANGGREAQPDAPLEFCLQVVTSAPCWETSRGLGQDEAAQ